MYELNQISFRLHNTKVYYWSCSTTSDYKCTIMLQKGLTPLHLATKKSFVKVVEHLVLAGATIGSQDNTVSLNI